jgi:hypothetical protein
LGQLVTETSDAELIFLKKRLAGLEPVLCKQASLTEIEAENWACTHRPKR